MPRMGGKVLDGTSTLRGSPAVTRSPGRVARLMSAAPPRVTRRRRHAQVFVERAGGGVVVDVDGNSMIDLGSASPWSASARPRGVAAGRSRWPASPKPDSWSGTRGIRRRLRGVARLTRGNTRRSPRSSIGFRGVENAVRCALDTDVTSSSSPRYHGGRHHGPDAKNMKTSTASVVAPEFYRWSPTRSARPGLSGADAALRALRQVETQVGAGNVAAVLIEPIQGEGGFVVPATGFLPAIVDWCRDSGAVFIADEIQTGFCRTGDWFACDAEGVVPDMITTAKGMAAGCAGRRHRPGGAMDAVTSAGSAAPMAATPRLRPSLATIATMGSSPPRCGAGHRGDDAAPAARPAGAHRRDRGRPGPRAMRPSSCPAGHDRARRGADGGSPRPATPRGRRPHRRLVRQLLRFLPPLVIGQDLPSRRSTSSTRAFASTPPRAEPDWAGDRYRAAVDNGTAPSRRRS